MKKWIACAVALASSGCRQDRPQAASLNPSAANFTYYTPATRLSLVGDFVLLRCEGTNFAVSSSLSLVATAGANIAAPFTLHGSSLMSARQRRELAIELYDNGTIKSLNASSSDRTGTIITNVLKTVASIAGAVVGLGSPAAAGAPEAHAGPCNPETEAALAEAKQLRSALGRLRRSLVGASPQDVESIGQRIELIAHQLALLITQQLTISVTKTLTVGDNPHGAGQNSPIRWTFSDLRRWFGDTAQPSSCTPTPTAGTLFSGGDANACEAVTTLLAMNYSISAEDVAIAGDRIAQSPCVTPTPDRASECGRTIVMPRPARGTVVFKTETNHIVGQPAGSALGQAAIPIPQWGRATYLPLDVRLFQSRSVGYTFSPFGLRQSFKWNSEATAENGTAALVSATEAAAGIVGHLDGPSETERLNADSAALEARMRNNRLRLCEQAILAGATTCE